MKEWIFSVVVLAIIIWVSYWVIQWMVLPGYVEKIANELKEINDVMKEKDKQI